MSGLRGRPAIALVARREITQRMREKSFLISMAVTVVLVVLVAVIPPLFGFGGKQTFKVAVTDDAVAGRRADGGPQRQGVRRRHQGPPDLRGGPDAALEDGKVDVVLSRAGCARRRSPTRRWWVCSRPPSARWRRARR